MNLTPIQEAQLLVQYTPKLLRMVSNFCAAADFRQRHRDDLTQEAKIAFLLHLRSMNDMNEIHLCRKPVLRAMYNFMEAVAPVHIPHNVFYKEIADVAVVPVNTDHETEAFMPSTPANEINAICEANDFIHLLDPKEQQLLSLRDQGYSNREIVGILQFNNEWQVGRRIKSIQNRYVRYAM